MIIGGEIYSLQAWSEISSQFFPILGYDGKNCLIYVVAMADFKQNQQTKNLWAECLNIISEWKILLICEILLKDHHLIDGKS